MKNVIIGILVAMAVAAMVAASLIFQPQYQNFRIAGVEFQEIHPYNDSTMRHFFLISFYTEFPNSRSFTITDSPMEPGYDGIDEPIKSIRIYDSAWHDVTSKLHGWDMDNDERLCYSIDGNTAFLYFLSAPDIASMVNRINDKEWNETGSRIGRSRLFFCDSATVPCHIVVKFASREIRNTLHEIR